MQVMKMKEARLRELRIISAIAETQSISSAAKVLGMAQANVSKCLSDFEKRIELKVFERTTRKVLLTRFGSILVSYINGLLNENAKLTDFIACYKYEKMGNVTIYAPSGIMHYLSRNILHKINDIGDIQVTLKTYQIGKEDFVEGVSFPVDCDILLGFSQPRDENLVCKRVGKLSFTAFCSAQYASSNPANKVEDLANHTCILLDSILDENNKIINFPKVNYKNLDRIQFKAGFVCDNTNIALELARKNLGVVFAPRDFLNFDLDCESLVPFFSDNEEWDFDFFAVYRKIEYQPYRVKFFISRLVDLFSSCAAFK